MENCYFIYKGKIFGGLDDVVYNLSKTLKEKRGEIINEAKETYDTLIKIEFNKQDTDYKGNMLKFDADRNNIENIYFNGQPVSFGIYYSLMKIKEQMSYIKIRSENPDECLKKLDEYKNKIDQLISEFTLYRSIGILKAARENGMNKIDLVNFLDSIRGYVNSELEKIDKYLSKNVSKRTYNMLMRRKYELEMFSEVDDYVGLELALEMLAILITFS